MVRFDASDPTGANSWTEPDHFEIRAKN
jgi:hypothetical protein